MIVHEMEQRSPEWYAVRAGKLTASSAQAIAAGGKGLETLVYETLAEKYALNLEPGYMSIDMMRGVELEDSARNLYEILHDTVRQVGFVEMDEQVGCSPDGLVGEEGGIEIKCPNNTKFFRMMVNGADEIEKQYIWQCQMTLLVTGRRWWDLCFYNPAFEKSLLVYRQEKNTEMQEKLLLGIEKGIKIIKEIEQKI